jgi:hypothetical protein
MRISRLLIISLILLSSLFLLGGAISFASTPAPNMPLGPDPIRGHQNHPRQLSPGSPAITPRTSGSPAITINDVRQYLQNTPFPGGPTVSGKPYTIVSITLMASKQASMIMHGEYVGIPDNQLVYYVVVRGPFILTGMSVPPGVNVGNKTPVVQTADEIFDAQTGNLLVFGVDG